MITDPAEHAEHAEGLWRPGPGSRLASGPENARVREMLAAALVQAVAAMPAPERGPDKRFGAARGAFARDWVLLAQKLGIPGPGAEQRAHKQDDEDALERHIDAAKTRLRQFQAGHAEFAWVLAGIESVICDRRGMALPAGAYQTQERLPL